MSALRFAAWGSIDIESMERFKRRQYIRQVRKELEGTGLELECGGHNGSPYYAIKELDSGMRIAQGGMKDSFARCCAAAVTYLEQKHAKPAG